MLNFHIDMRLENLHILLTAGTLSRSHFQYNGIVLCVRPILVSVCHTFIFYILMLHRKQKKKTL